MNNKTISIITSVCLMKTLLPPPTIEESRAPLDRYSFIEKMNSHPKPQIIYTDSPDRFELGQVDGAIHFNLQAEGYASLLYTLDQNEPVFICEAGNGESGQLAKDLRGVGFTELYELENVLFHQKINVTWQNL